MAVLRSLLTATDDKPVWGLGICREADLGPGTVYPILDRLLTLEWISDFQEDEPHPGRPARRYFTMTEQGRASAECALAMRAARGRHGR